MKLPKALKVLAGILVAFGLYVAYGFYREPIAEAQARDFCASVKIGEPAKGLRERALKAGAERRYADFPDSERTLWVVFVGTPPFSRHACLITLTDVVVSTKYEYFD